VTGDLPEEFLFRLTSQKIPLYQGNLAESNSRETASTAIAL